MSATDEVPARTLMPLLRSLVVIPRAPAANGAKRQRMHRLRLVDLRAAGAAVGKLERRLRLAQIAEPITSSRKRAGAPPVVGRFPKRNLRSTVESTNRCKNEPKTNLNEPKGT